MPPLKKRKKFANESKDDIASKDKVETYAKPRFQQTVNSALKRKSKGQMKIPFVKSKPLKDEETVEESSPIHNVIVPDTVLMPSSDFGIPELNQNPGRDHIGASAKNKKSDFCGEDTYAFSMTRDKDGGCLENEADAFVEVIHHRKTIHSSNATCISNKLTIENMKEIDNDRSSLETYGIVITETNEDVPSKIDEKERKGKTYSEPSKDAAKLGSALAHVNTADVLESNRVPDATNYSVRPTCEYVSQSDKQALVSLNVCIKGEPILGDRACMNQHNSNLAIGNVEQNQSRFHSDFKHQRNSKLVSSNCDSVLERNDFEVVESRETGNKVRSSGSKMHPNSDRSIENNVSEPKDKIGVVAAVVVKILSKYHQSNRIADKVS